MTNKKQPIKGLETGMVRLAPLVVNTQKLLGTDPLKAHDKLVGFIGTHAEFATIAAFVGACVMATSDDESDTMMPYFLLAPSVRQMANICKLTPLYQKFKADKELKEWEVAIDRLPPHIAIMGVIQAMRHLAAEIRQRYESSKSPNHGIVMLDLITMITLNLPAALNAAQILMDMETPPDVQGEALGAGDVTMMGGLVPLMTTNFRRLFKLNADAPISAAFTAEYLFKLDTLLTLTHKALDLTVSGQLCEECAFDEVLTPLLRELNADIRKQKVGAKVAQIIKHMPTCDDDRVDVWRTVWLTLGAAIFSANINEESDQPADKMTMYTTKAVTDLNPASTTTVAVAGIQRYLTKSTCKCKRGVELLSTAKTLN